MVDIQIESTVYGCINLQNMTWEPHDAWNLENPGQILENWVVWNMHFIFPYIGNVIIPTDELHDFSEGRRKTTNQQHIINIPSGNWLQFAIENGHRNSRFSH